MNWDAFWPSLLANVLPGLGVSALMLFLTARVNRTLERHKKEMEQNLVKFSNLHDKRLEAMVTVYHAFCDYLDFLRRQLYAPGPRESMDPMWEFNRTLERQIIYLDETTASTITRYQSELLAFWNWAMVGPKLNEKPSLEEVQRRLDFDIPMYLPKLRNAIKSVIDPHHPVAA